MCNKGVSKAKEGAIPLKDGRYGVWDLKCSHCGVDWWVILGMTEKQLEIDREHTLKSVG